MLRRTVRAQADASTLQAGLDGIAAELEVPVEFPPAVVAAAEQAAGAVVLPAEDRTDVALVTIDPPGSMDLDQALHLERAGDGFRVYYAIADVATFVVPGGPVDLEAHKRGETLYAPDRRTPLHPKVLSEGAASLLPDQLRPALLWCIELDATGELTSVDVRRARVRSRARLDYTGAQEQLDRGEGSDSLRLLREVGMLREQRERERGGINLALPDQEVAVTAAGWALEYRALLPVEGWNAQISLLTGMCAARMMLDGKVGLLRTLPPPDPRDVARLRRTARALHVDWPDSLTPAEFIRGLDPTTSQEAAMLTACTALLGGAGYAAFDGEAPDQPMHSAIAAEYAHATAPLRRLGDRYVGEVCVALCAGTPVPDWVRAALPDLPKTMAQTGQTAKHYERAVVDLVEAGVLATLVGQEFGGVVVDTDDNDPRRGAVMLSEPAVQGPVSAAVALPLGAAVTVRLTEADVTKRRVHFELVV